jgi:hypothetical protein
MKLKSSIRRMLPQPFAQSYYRRQALQYIDNAKTEIDPSRKTLLIINHYYDQDIHALRLANTDYNLAVIDGPELFKGGKIYFSDDVMRLRAPYADAPADRRAKFRDYSRIIFDRLFQRFPFFLIITASDNFWWVREFIAVGKERGVKTVVLDKEGTRSPYAVRGETERIRRFAPFMSDHIFVWSERQRRFWRDTGVADEDITVIGQPRSDLFFKEHPHEIDRFFPKMQPLITLFSYEDTAYIPPAQVMAGGPSWRKMKRETHEAVAQLAQAHPHYNFVVKAHPQQSDLSELQRLYRRENLAIIGGSSVANELIQRSELIIAFQTTAVIEAMMLGKPVVYTTWDDYYSRFAPDLLPFHDAPGIVVADSSGRFRDVCGRFLSGDRSDFQFSPEICSAREQFVNEYFHNPDGHVCERFFKHIGRFVS